LDEDETFEVTAGGETVCESSLKSHSLKDKEGCSPREGLAIRSKALKR
jgi:hypothetical protein